MSGLTISQKILAAHSGNKEVAPGQIIEAEVDLLMMNDLGTPIAIDQFEQIGIGRVFDPAKVVLIPDHSVPNKDVRAAEQTRRVREFARAHGIRFFELGEMGIEHALLAEQGFVYPGMLFLGGDSHTCTAGALGCFAAGIGSTDGAAVLATGRLWLRVPETMRVTFRGTPGRWVTGKDLILHTLARIGDEGARYRSIEFGGEALASLSMDDRFSITNMASEAGAKTAIMEPDEATLEYLEGRVTLPYAVVRSDPDASFVEQLELDVGKLEPQVAVPFSPSNSRDVSAVGTVAIDQAVIGSCTNGRITDLRIAASILRSRKVHRGVRLIIIPATQTIYLQALREGLIEVFIQAGGVVSTPTCGPCLGGHMGILASGEKAIATTNRNFRGRMGAVDSEVYLSNPAVAAASAVLGRIGSPEEIVS
ncbi:MAG TPA: 3-isopropylmalate dehydratase large subunit [Candidatus Methylomirabilis sp.]|nr:3-isopropylmalate dehydratase large subunit [Candidatus Methylomirabilis sp.]